MPIPNPHKGEKEDVFMDRCMGDDVMNEEYPDNKTRSGICSTQWDNKDLTEWIDGLQLVNSKAEPRDEIMLFPFGDFDHPVYGKMQFNNDFFNEIIDNYNGNVLHVKPFMDKQHDEDKSLAWFDNPPYIRPGQGLFIKPDYTDLGKATLSRKEYRYFSPSWGPYKDPQSGKEFKNVLRGGAATNIPFLKTMPPIIDETAVLNDQWQEIKLTDLTTKSSTDAGGKADDSTTGQTLAVGKKQGDKMKDVKKLFDLNEDAPESDVVSKVEDLQKENEALKAKVAELEAKPTDDNTAEKELKEQVDKLQVQLTERDCDTHIQKALSEGRIEPAKKEYWEKRFMADPENVAQDLENLPKVVDFSETGKSGQGKKELTEDPGKALVAEANKLIAEKRAQNLDDAMTIIYAENKKLYEAYEAKYRS
jgi:phage I-like protein